MTNAIRKVGFAGLGRIGTGLAHSILRGGFDLKVYNRTASKMKPLLDAGASPAGSFREAASDVDVFCSCLMDDPSMMEAMHGEDGILAGLAPGAVHLGIATISAECAAELAELHAAHGSHYVAGPVVARAAMALAGEAFTFLAGDPDVVARVKPLCESYTKKIFLVGEDHRLANRTKLAWNFVVITQIELMGQLFSFVEKLGLSQELGLEIMDICLGSPILKSEYGRSIAAREFDEAGFELVSGFKDVRYILDASNEVGAPLPFASAIREKMVSAMARGMEKKDWSAIYEITRFQAGLDSKA